MGVWGAGIFSDDNASDIREDYRGMIGDGLRGRGGDSRLLREWASSIEHEPDQAAIFWLALGVMQGPGSSKVC
ncbi:MAG: hypothetical protein DMG24_05485 [Acidobacteria bacterium]|nr:MAG: hypothetical protein DMG24_05485 [Acidobacteriota bacterium]